MTQTSAQKKKIENKLFQHYKGGLYLLLCVAKEEATLKEVVIYRGEDGTVWSRPYDEFFSDVVVSDEFVPRFRQLPQ